MPQVECNAITQGLLNNPLQFLSQNIVYVNMNEEGPPTRNLRRFDAAQLPGNPLGFNGNAGGGAIYSVGESGDGEILAHYLPWNMDAGYYIILNRGSPVRLMFTAALSGCAVGVTWANDGSARVSHHNIQGPEGTDDQAQRGSLVFTQAALHRNRYRFSVVSSELMVDGFAHVHGVRRLNGPWRFYVQVMRKYLNMTSGVRQFSIVEVGELR